MQVQSQFIEMFGDCQQLENISSLCDTFIDGDWIESKDQSNEGIRLIQTGNVGNGFFKDKEDQCRFISNETFDKLHCTEIFPGDILVARLPDPIGRSCIIPDGLGRMITAVDCSIIRLKASILPYFFIAYTMTSTYSGQINEVTTGTTRRRVSRANLGNIKVPTPPTDQQKLFVSIAEQADKSKFVGFKSQFIEMFGNTTPTKKISDICNVRGGSTPTRTMKEYWEDGTVSWFTVEDIYEQGRYISDTKQHITELATKKCFVYPIDTVLICCTASVGEYAITKKEMASNQQFNGMIIKDKNKVHPEFLLYVASTLKDDLLRKAGKTTINFVSRSKLEEIEIPVPAIEEQKRFISIFQQSDKSKFELRKSIEAIDQVIKSLINN